MDKIYRVSLSLDANGFRQITREINVKITDKCFIGDGYRIRKDELMRINTSFVETYKWMKYYTYCIDGDQEKSIDMLKTHIIEKLKGYKSELDVLLKYIQ